MPVNVFPRVLFAISVCFWLLALAQPTFAQSGGPHLTAAQTLNPTDFNAWERDYYKTLTDPIKAKSFIVTRSYMRLAQKLVDHKMPALQFPAGTPMGFSFNYLLPGEKAVRDKAIEISLTALMKEKLK
jgi:hypothetical protein